MDDHLRASERIQALAERHARVNADGWRHTPAPRRSVRARLATTLVALAARLDPVAVPIPQPRTPLAPATPA